ncbi:MAG TPA: hypothetical protein VHY30_09040 [Verrucomicrobiae bacterium]|nr:hypothetical protein [Verrucomicrobiae bacterium]
MKNKFINQKLGGLTQPKLSVAIALACGFWVSQFLAWAFVGTVLGALPNIIGVLSFGALVFFFLIRAPHSRSRLPAILGLCSSGVLISLFAYLNYFILGSVEVTELYFSLAFGLAFVGVVIDVKRFWHLIANTGKPHQMLKPTRPSVIPTGYVGNATHV